MNDEQLLRYSRHILLPQIDYDGQEKLTQARVAIIGLGGLGCPAAQYLTSAGIGELHLIDGDCVSLENLQRQILFNRQNIGEKKVLAAKQRLNDLNADVEIITHEDMFSLESHRFLSQDFDVVLDCSDNFPTRFLVNQFCHQSQTPLISGAAIGFGGQVIAFSMQPASPCYACLFPEETQEEADCCSEQGVLAPVVGVIGSMQASLAIQILIGQRKHLFNRLHVFDAYRMCWRDMVLHQDSDCTVCQTALA